MISRGYVPPGYEKDYQDTTFEKRIALLTSFIPAERTLGARLLSGNSDLSSIQYLTSALIRENKLYSRIEICNSLVSFGKNGVIPLVGLLGRIGNNQHKDVPENGFKKISYPLPRDIAGRTLIRIGSIALPELLNVLESKDMVSIPEAVDAIGFICFYNYQPGIFAVLKSCFLKNPDNDLIKWKIVRAMSAFPESETFLMKQKTILTEQKFQTEIDRSLFLIAGRNKR
jgi:hypothetical protein